MAQVAVTTTPVQLVPAANGGVLVKNIGGTTLYVDFTATVTAATGFPVDPGESVSVSRTYPGQQQVWAVTASGSTTAAVLVGTV